MKLTWTIGRSATMVCMVDEKYARSKYCVNELTMAQACGCLIYPILLGKMSFDKLPPGLRYGLSTTNCIPFPHTAERANMRQMGVLLQSMCEADVPSASAIAVAPAPGADLAAVPTTCPVLSPNLNPRHAEFRSLLEALLDDRDGSPSRFTICGMVRRRLILRFVVFF